MASRQPPTSKSYKHFIFDFKNNLETMKRKVDENDVRNFDNECYEPRPYFNYMIYTLRVPLSFHFQSPVNLTKSQYGFLVSNVKLLDSKSLSTALTKLNPYIAINCDRMYIKDSIETMYDRLDDNDTSFENKQWMLTILITGYKEDEMKRATPVWKIVHVAQV